MSANHSDCRYAIRGVQDPVTGSLYTTFSVLIRVWCNKFARHSGVRRAWCSVTQVRKPVAQLSMVARWKRPQKNIIMSINTIMIILYSLQQIENHACTCEKWQSTVWWKRPRASERPGPWDSHPALQHYRELIANPILFTILKDFCVWCRSRFS